MKPRISDLQSARYFMFAILGLLIIVLVSRFLFQKKPEVSALECGLTVYSYTSMVAGWGPGPELAKMFHEKTKCSLKWVDAGGAVEMINRVTLEKDGTPADVLMGIDDYTISRVEALPVRQHLLDLSEFDERVLASDQLDAFYPFDWAPLTFIRKTENTTGKQLIHDYDSWKSFLEQTPRIALIDPRSSSAGFQFIAWLTAGVADKQLSLDTFRFVKSSAAGVFPSWSDAYAAFTSGQAEAVFTYTTSAAYHRFAEGNLNYELARFKTGHPYQVEYAAIVSHTKNFANAQRFLALIGSVEGQKVISLKNYMLPARTEVTDLAWKPYEDFQLQSVNSLLKPKEINELWIKSY
ncbi:MAG: hypothetical protein COT74_09445 [Bdellovibrionales bacterium CG10_big_fil_rev_8_21_14_0_10_45_34]|nr:MAG: hypothetical protein COT74_09445 [Bdellovibrionales bacterium CG10_big_fil_rev_8_21_14_0_10_45_34]